VSNTEDKNDKPIIVEPIHDLYLRMLISLLETDKSHGASASITLTTNSGVIYGHLITREAWKGLWVEQMKTATGTGVDAVRDFPAAIDRAVDDLFEESGEERPADSGLPYFVHLRNVTMYVPGANQIGLPLWRGRLEAVTGWALGTP
jgi:hypothetical protein